jgi:ribokinase
LSGIKVGDRRSARRAGTGTALVLRGVEAAIIEAGDEGNLLVLGCGEEWLPRLPVRAVDATGAGDAFSAALSVALAERQSFEEAGHFASAAAALATTALGAQSGLLRRSELLAYLAQITV